jgi:class 3 adenylate cyclase
MPEDAVVRYARSGDIDIAYIVKGDGPIDIVLVPGFVSNLDMVWDFPPLARVYNQLASVGRLITFDKRGTGLSDRTPGLGSLADRMDDIRAVIDAVGAAKVAMFAVSEGGPLSLLYAATYPDHVARLALDGTFARGRWAPDYPAGYSDAFIEAIPEVIRNNWGDGSGLKLVFQHIPDEATPLLARYERSACSPKSAAESIRANFEIDVRSLLPAVAVPTLVVHRTRDPLIPVAAGRYIAERIPGARFIEIDDDYHAAWDMSVDDRVLDFLGGAESSKRVNRILATVLFTDIVASTERGAEVGDRRWRDLLDRHDGIARTEIARSGGVFVKTTGDGVLATFDGPARGIECAQRMSTQLRTFGLDVRAGVHTGEVEKRGDDISGLGVVIARRVCDLAATGELLASRTVRDLVIGSDIAFADRGTHTLKGIPEDWQLFAVA